MTTTETETTNTLQEGDTLFLIRDAAGIYIPQEFAEAFGATEHLSNVDPADLDILRAGPDHESYWEAWESVLDGAILTDDHGCRYSLFQSGDLWAIREGVELPEEWFF